MPRTPWFPRRQPRMAATAAVGHVPYTPSGQPIVAAAGWQTNAIRHAEKIPVVSLAAGLTRNLISRLDWYVSVDGERADNSDEILAQVVTQGGLDGLAGLVAWNYTITGEIWVGYHNAEWITGAVGAITQASGGMLRVRRSEANRAYDLLIEAARMQRLWNPHPLFSSDPYSPMIAAAEDCDRYLELGQSTRRMANQRLTKSGIVWTPSEAHHWQDQQGQGGPSMLEKQYYDAAQVSLADVSSSRVAAVAPILMHSPAEYGEPKYVDLGSKLQAEDVALRDAALNDIARAMPIPSIVLVDGPGAGGNHWGDLLADQQTFRQGLAPLADQIAVDLSKAVLRPILAAGRIENPSRYELAYDPSPVVIPPDERANALRLYELGLVTASYVLDTHGVEEEDRVLDGERVDLPRVVPPEELTIPNMPAVAASLREWAYADTDYAFA